MLFSLLSSFIYRYRYLYEYIVYKFGVFHHTQKKQSVDVPASVECSPSLNGLLFLRAVRCSVIRCRCMWCTCARVCTQYPYILSYWKERLNFHRLVHEKYVYCVCALVCIITLEQSLCIKTKVSTWYILSTRLLVCRLLSCNSVMFCDCMSPRCTYTCRCWVLFFRLYFSFISPEINFTCVTKTNFFFNSSLQQVATREKHCAFFFLHSSFSTMRFIFNVPASHIFRHAVLCDFGYVMSCANMIRKKPLYPSCVLRPVSHHLMESKRSTIIQ